MKTVPALGVFLGMMLSALYVTPLHAQGTNVAVIDINQIFQQHQRFVAEREVVRNAVKQFEQGMTAEREAMQKKSDQLKLYKPGTPDYKQVEQELAKMAADLQVRISLKRKEFLEQEAKIYYQAYLEIQAVIREFSERHQIGLVLRFSGQEIDPSQQESVMRGINRAVVYQDRIDITGEILAKLNSTTAAPAGQQPAASRAQIPRRR